jgi:hypothetical protein
MKFIDALSGSRISIRTARVSELKVNKHGPDTYEMIANEQVLCEFIYNNISI